MDVEAEVGTSKITGEQGSHNKPIGCGASGAYAAGPDDEEGKGSLKWILLFHLTQTPKLSSLNVCESSVTIPDVPPLGSCHLHNFQPTPTPTPTPILILPPPCWQIFRSLPLTPHARGPTNREFQVTANKMHRFYIYLFIYLFIYY
jgi:hypothetical protein